MKTIRVKLKLWGLIPFSKQGQIPESWDDVSDKQLIAIARMMLMEQTQIKSLADITNIPYWVIKQLNDWELFNVIKPLSFMSDYRPRNCFIIPNIKQLVAPRHKLENMLWGQFIYVEHFFNKMISDPSNENLNLIVAHLYIPKNEVYDPDICRKRASEKLITDLPYEKKYAIVINYRLIREWLAVIYKLIFQKKSEAKAPSSDHPKNIQSSSWIDLHDQIVGDDIVHNEDYASLKLHTVMRFLTRKIKQNVRKR